MPEIRFPQRPRRGTEKAPVTVQENLETLARMFESGSATGQVLTWDSTKKKFVAQAAPQAFPVGSIFMAVVATNPATLLGYGTWAAFGTGRMPVGIDAGQTEFDTVEETGGAKTHTLVTGEMPTHTHPQDSHTHTQNSHNHGGATPTLNLQYRVTTTATGAQLRVTDLGGVTGEGGTGTVTVAFGINSDTAVNQATTATNQNTGGGGAHNNLPPYIVVYMWKRTA